VNAVIKAKSKDRPEWNPATVEEVTDDIVDRFFHPSAGYLDSAPALDIPQQLNNDVVLPMRFALPTEEEIGQVVSGSHTSGGATSVSLEELVSRFNDLRSGKMGVKEKIIEVASRRCEIKDNADGNTVWLKWKRQPTPP
jgi:3-hydroxyisobutyryl-CoA hydrolase